jgi:hypothetical protein
MAAGAACKHFSCATLYLKQAQRFAIHEFSKQICLLQCVSVVDVEGTWPEHRYDVVFVAVILRLCPYVTGMT